jgi:hypothetical protein
MKQPRLSPIAHISMTVLSLKVNLPGGPRPKNLAALKKFSGKNRGRLISDIYNFLFIPASSPEP